MVVQLYELPRGQKSVVFPYCVDIARRVGQNSVYILRETGIGIDYLAVGVENSYASLEITEVFEQPFAVGARLTSLFFYLLVGFHDFAAYIAQFGVGKVDFLVGHVSPFCVIHEFPEPGNRFSHAV